MRKTYFDKSEAARLDSTLLYSALLRSALLCSTPLHSTPIYDTSLYSTCECLVPIRAPHLSSISAQVPGVLDTVS